MSAEHGAYVELLTKGKIKRDLAGVSGEVSLEGTTISDEVILFSELSFGPYAVVVDLIRFQAKAILKHDDHGGLADMTEFQAMLDTVEDLVSTLEEEFPLHGTLLRAQLEDEVPADDGTAMYPFLASRKILTILAEVMQFQFVPTKYYMTCKPENQSFLRSMTRCGRFLCVQSCAGMEAP